ncbi:transposable element Tcb2 transposase [Trichonephila clavipes]|nr:transposable element Tcb2 transposase [Trichonephila clavipes]
MDEILKEMFYDSANAPLGKLTFKQITDGYAALNKIAEVISRNGEAEELLKRCEEFYMKIPHNFGLNHLEWCRSRSSWLPSDWHRIVFSDESRFTLEADDHRFVWRVRSQGSSSVFVLQWHTSITPCDGMRFYLIRQQVHTSLTAQRYVDTILWQIVLPFMVRHPGPVFNKIMRSHTACISLDCHRSIILLLT